MVEGGKKNLDCFFYLNLTLTQTEVGHVRSDLNHFDWRMTSIFIIINDMRKLIPAQQKTYLDSLFASMS